MGVHLCIIQDKMRGEEKSSPFSFFTLNQDVLNIIFFAPLPYSRFNAPVVVHLVCKISDSKLTPSRLIADLRCLCYYSSNNNNTKWEHQTRLYKIRTDGSFFVPGKERKCRLLIGKMQTSG